ncbi:MAG TPA: trimeric intracellular cation channel family protein [Gemmatimonadaceae bacterium]|jgi:uncharacterized membrane protein YeiH|nr:trimeric intracellular cation channel family protein [Gemmatimonadaceae bacterium]
MQIIPDERVIIAGFLVVFDLVGTFVFALSGAVAGIRHRLDLFGVLVLSFAAATSGGVLRDVLIGMEMPAAIRDWRYVAVSVLAGLLAFYRPSGIQRFRNSVLWFDAGGLALFAVTGASKAIAYSVNPVSSALLGMLTGIGGGVVRDVLVSEVPTVFRAELYAVTALAGASVVVAGHMLDLPPGPVATAGAALCFVLRSLGIRRGWRLPLAEGVEESTGATHTAPEPPDDTRR